METGHQKSPAVLALPFTLQSASQEVRFAEDAWNSRDPERVALAYTEDSAPGPRLADHPGIPDVR